MVTKPLQSGDLNSSLNQLINNLDIKDHSKVRWVHIDQYFVHNLKCIFPFSKDHQWNPNETKSQQKIGMNAGGMMNAPGTTWTNPSMTNVPFGAGVSWTCSIQIFSSLFFLFYRWIHGNNQQHPCPWRIHLLRQMDHRYCIEIEFFFVLSDNLSFSTRWVIQWITIILTILLLLKHHTAIHLLNKLRWMIHSVVFNCMQIEKKCMFFLFFSFY